MNRNGTSRSPSVILADDNPAYSYGFGSPKRNNAASGG
ncbi:unnamed protein product [Haemonchus placei]|uniref:Transposase n=2 Tax=Haemonchus TaxID=6288 RepID=A0A0N4X6Q3_HAEPC|nr:unnamed protein product [Haemonchus placei]